MPVRKNLCAKADYGCGDMPCHRFPTRSGKVAPSGDYRSTGDDEGEHEHPTGDDSAESAQHSHEVITGTPVALPASSSNCAGSVVNSPSRMVLLAP
jgi:hypothetical protein